MGKKFIVFMLSLIMILSVFLSGCSDNSSSSNETDVIKQNTVVDNRGEQNKPENTGHAVLKVSDEDFDVKEYLYENSFSTEDFLVITNNSKATVSVSGNGIAKDKEGKMIGASDISIDVLGPGETSIGYFYFNDVKGIDKVEYSLSYDTDVYYAPVISNLEIEQTLNDNNVTVKALNTGKTCAEFVEARALFFDENNNVIEQTSNYLVDNDNEIKPGKSVTAQLDTYEQYDHVEVYFTGRSTGKTVVKTQSGVSDEDFEIAEHIYSNSFATEEFLVVKSNASVPVMITGNATAKDKDGNVLGASDIEIDIIGPGETSIGYFYFNGVNNIDSIEYQLDYDTEPYYLPVISNLSVEQTVNDNNVIVAITNENSLPASFVEVHALFFDDQNKVINYEYTYAVDDDEEIKPGKMQVVQLDSYKSFDHVEVYLTGRAQK